MILRIIIILLVVIFYDKIFDFLKKNNIETPQKLKKTVVNKVSNITNSIVNNDFENALKIVKKVDRKTYKKCVKILKNIDTIKKDLVDNKYIDFKNEYYNIKLHKNCYDLNKKSDYYTQCVNCHKIGTMGISIEDLNCYHHL